MVQPNSGLGINVSFPKELFENGIRFAMEMGTPNEESKRVTFVFPGNGVSYWKDGVELPDPPRLDLDGHPYDPEVEVRKGVETTLQVDCAFEVGEAPPNREDPVGTFQRTQLTVTLLEAEYQQVVGCKAVDYNGDRFNYGYESSNYGLFDANVHQMIFVSEDDS